MLILELLAAGLSALGPRQQQQQQRGDPLLSRLGDGLGRTEPQRLLSAVVYAMQPAVWRQTLASSPAAHQQQRSTTTASEAAGSQPQPLQQRQGSSAAEEEELAAATLLPLLVRCHSLYRLLAFGAADGREEESEILSDYARVDPSSSFVDTSLSPGRGAVTAAALAARLLQALGLPEGIFEPLRRSTRDATVGPVQPPVSAAADGSTPSEAAGAQLMMAPMRPRPGLIPLPDLFQDLFLQYADQVQPSGG